MGNGCCVSQEQPLKKMQATRHQRSFKDQQQFLPSENLKNAGKAIRQQQAIFSKETKPEQFRRSMEQRLEAIQQKLDRTFGLLSTQKRQEDERQKSTAQLMLKINELTNKMIQLERRTESSFVEQDIRNQMKTMISQYRRSLQSKNRQMELYEQSMQEIQLQFQRLKLNVELILANGDLQSSGLKSNQNQQGHNEHQQGHNQHQHRDNQHENRVLLNSFSSQRNQEFENHHSQREQLDIKPNMNVMSEIIPSLNKTIKKST